MGATNGASKPIEILVVDDDEGDTLIMKEALRHAKVRNPIHMASDGVEALEFLRRKGKHAKAPRPDLIFLDLNMPRMNGFELLKEIKGDRDLRKIPVVVLTTSSADEDVVKSYVLHANAFASKPVEFESFMATLSEIRDFWLQVVRLPPKSENSGGTAY
jgi:CheY-like chemotaxis protein